MDEDFARYYWPHSSALGQRLFQGSDEAKIPKHSQSSVLSAARNKRALPKIQHKAPSITLYLSPG